MRAQAEWVTGKDISMQPRHHDALPNQTTEKGDRQTEVLGERGERGVVERSASTETRCSADENGNGNNRQVGHDGSFFYRKLPSCVPSLNPLFALPSFAAFAHFCYHQMSHKRHPCLAPRQRLLLHHHRMLFTAAPS